MKKKILAIVLCLACLFSLTACTDTSKGATNFSSNYVNLEVLEDTRDGRILVDRDSGVLYLWYRDGNQYAQLTPLYNADGSLKNIKDFE
jgi:hypothetical protein